MTVPSAIFIRMGDTVDDYLFVIYSMVGHCLVIGVSTKKLTESRRQLSWMKGMTRWNNESVEEVEEMERQAERWAN